MVQQTGGGWSRLVAVVTGAAVAAVVPLAAACSDSPGPGGAGEPRLARVELTPQTASAPAGGAVQFQAVAVMTDGSTPAGLLSFGASGGTITSGGLYTAGTVAGTYRVVATGGGQGGPVADTALVTVTVPPPAVTLTDVAISPRTATLAAGGAQAFQAQGRYSDGSTGAVAVVYTATGGAVTPAGLYTAGTTPGSYRVIAAAQGAAHADTALVTVTGSGGGGGSYQPVVGEDWTRYASLNQLKAAGLFGWQGTGDVFNHVALVPDATFGQVVRIRFPQNSGDIGQAPRLNQSLPQPLQKMWFRWRVKWTPGWTTVGPDPAGANNSYKLVFWTWEGFNGRANLIFINTTEYYGEWFVTDQQGRKIDFAETLLPGSARNLGRVNTEWQDNQWYEYVAYYETTSATGGRQHWWRRKLTEGGQVVNNPWLYYGMGFSGNTMPRVDGVQLGVNKNKNNPTDMYLSWGPWEVVDGSRYANPFGMPGF